MGLDQAKNIKAIHEKTAPKKQNRQTSQHASDPKIQRALDSLVSAHHYAEKHFDTQIKSHSDWILIQLLLKNDSEGRSIVVKHVIETVGCSPGTVRHMFARFEKAGYIKAQQKIGRSELYRPTAKLKKFVSQWVAHNFSKPK